MAKPYASAREHLDDALERARLLLLRHIVRYWFRITDASGKLSDLYATTVEVRRAIQGHFILHDGPPESKGLPSMPEVERALDEHQASMLERLAASVETGLSFPLENLRAIFGLSELEVDLLLVLAGVQLDLSLQRMATLAWGDFAVKLPTVGWLAEVVTSSRDELGDAQRLAMPGHRLRRLRLVECQPDERSPILHTTELLQRVFMPGRITAFLRDWPSGFEGDGVELREHNAFDDLDLFCRVSREAITLDALGQPPSVAEQFRVASRYALRTVRNAERGGFLAEAVPILVFTGLHGVDHARIARACFGGRAVLEIDLWRRVQRRQGVVLAKERDLEQDLACGVREAMLLDATPLINLADLLEETDVVEPLCDAMRRVLPMAEGGLILISVSKVGAPLRALLGPCAELRIQPPAPERRVDLWKRALDEHDATIQPEPALEEVANRYTITAGAIRSAASRAAFEAKLLARARKMPRGHVVPADLHRAVRRQIEHTLGMLAEPFSTSLTWDDVILDAETRSRLREMVQYGHNAQRVHTEWGFGRLNPYGRGLTAMFSGPPGTGKTLCAAIIARELGAELFMVDLSRVVDKYIGETEKNIGKIFDEAERAGAVLLFDEADSLFGRRTGVRSANDRYANLEVNFLLQRMEHFDGTSILTTNLASSMDEALMRRLKFRLDFKMPDEEAREQLWRKMIPPQAPLARDIAWWKLAEEFELAPGHIKNSVMRAAFRAAQEDRTITYHVLREAAVVEYRELGYLVQE